MTRQTKMTNIFELSRHHYPLQSTSSSIVNIILTFRGFIWQDSFRVTGNGMRDMGATCSKGAATTLGCCGEDTASVHRVQIYPTELLEHPGTPTWASRCIIQVKDANICTNCQSGYGRKIFIHWQTEVYSFRFTKKKKTSPVNSSHNPVIKNQFNYVAVLISFERNDRCSDLWLTRINFPPTSGLSPTHLQ